MESFAGCVKIAQVLQVDGVIMTHYFMWVNANRRNLCLVERAKKK
jgi:glycerol-3-phosphate responsive antiterminator